MVCRESRTTSLGSGIRSLILETTKGFTYRMGKPILGTPLQESRMVVLSPTSLLTPSLHLYYKVIKILFVFKFSHYIFISAAQVVQLFLLPTFTQPCQHQLTSDGAYFASIKAVVAGGGEVRCHFSNYFFFIFFKNQ